MDDDFETVIEALSVQRSIARHAVEICNQSRHSTNQDQHVDELKSIYEEIDELIRNLHRGRSWISGSDKGIKDVGAYMHDVQAQLLRTEDTLREYLTSGHADGQGVQHEGVQSWMDTLMDMKPNIVCAKAFGAILQQGNKIKDCLSQSGTEQCQHDSATVTGPTARQQYVESPPERGRDHGRSAMELKHLNSQLDAVIGLLQGRVPTPMAECPPVHDAAIIGDIDLMQFILREHPEFVSARDDYQMTPIAYAIQHGHTMMVDFLLKRGVKVNETFGRYDTTPLGLALRCRQLRITKLLLTRDVNLASKDRHGWTALYHLWHSDENAPAQDFLRALRVRPDFDDLFHGVRDEKGWYLLHRAASFGHAGDVQLLIDYGLDAYARVRATCSPGSKQPDEVGWRPLHFAAYYGRLDTVRVLLPLYERVGMIDVKDRDGATPLHMAIDRGHLEVAKLLLADGASWRRQTSFTWLKDQERGRGHSARLLSQNMGREFHGQLQSYVRQLRTLVRDFELDPVHAHGSAYATGSHCDRTAQHVVHNDQDDTPLRLRRQPPDGYAPCMPIKQHFQRTYGNLNIRDGRLHQGDFNDNSININLMGIGAREHHHGRNSVQRWLEYYFCMGIGMEELDE